MRWHATNERDHATRRVDPSQRVVATIGHIHVPIGINSNTGTIDAGQTFGVRADYAIKRLR